MINDFIKIGIVVLIASGIIRLIIWEEMVYESYYIAVITAITLTMSFFLILIFG